jgi:hypothetical protein
MALACYAFKWTKLLTISCLVVASLEKSGRDCLLGPVSSGFVHHLMIVSPIGGLAVERSYARVHAEVLIPW